MEDCGFPQVQVVLSSKDAYCTFCDDGPSFRPKDVHGLTLHVNIYAAVPLVLGA